MKKIFLICLFLSGCTFQTVWDGPGGRSCRAQCSVPSGSGEGCIEWANDATDACQGKFTVVSMCCTQYGSCQTYNEFVKGTGCYCQTPYGVVPGVGCGRGRKIKAW